MNRNFGGRALLTAVMLAAGAVWLAGQGQGYSTPVEVWATDSVEHPDYVQLAVDSTGVHVFWRVPYPMEKFLMRRTTDGGTTFATDPVDVFPPRPGPMMATCMAGLQYVCPRPDQFAVDGQGGVYVIGEQQVGDLWGLLFSRSSDYGATFSEAISLYTDDVNYFGPEEAQIAVDAWGNVTVVWTTDGEQIFLRRSTDAGLTFGDAVELPSLPGYKYEPRMALDSAGNVNLVWVVWENTLLFTRLLNGPGGLELQPYVLLSPAGTDPVDPQIAIGPEGSINVVWRELSGGARIVFSRSLDAGQTFSEPAVVTSNADARSPQLALGHYGAINVAWETSDLVEKAAYFSRSVDGGASFSSPVKVMQTPVLGKMAYAAPPQLAVDAADNSHIAWTLFSWDDGAWMTVVARTVGNTTSFSEPQVLMGSGPKHGLPTNPKIAADEMGNVTVAWQEDYGVFIATFTAGSTPTGEDVTVQPVDPTTGTAPVTVTFTDVTEPGETTVVTSSQGPPPTGAFKLGTPPVYYQISTTATVTFPVTICIDYSGSEFNNEANLQLGHWTGTGWEMLEPTSLDTNSNVICAEVMSFSTFAVFEKGYEFDGFLAPVLNDGSAVFNSGRTVPLKFYLKDAGGNLVTGATAWLSVFKISNEVEGTVPVEVASAGSANSGSLFRVDASTGQYVYNPGMRGYQGTFLIRATLDDGTAHEVRVSVR